MFWYENRNIHRKSHRNNLFLVNVLSNLIILVGISLWFCVVAIFVLSYWVSLPMFLLLFVIFIFPRKESIFSKRIQKKIYLSGTRIDSNFEKPNSVYKMKKLSQFLQSVLDYSIFSTFFFLEQRVHFQLSCYYGCLLFVCCCLFVVVCLCCCNEFIYSFNF